MVSEITTVRLWSQQTALRGFKEVSDESAPQSASQSSGSSQSSLADILFSGSNSDDADDDTSLSRLIATLQQQAMAGGAPADEAGDAAGDGAVEDIESKAFMKALTAKLEELEGSSGTSAMAEAMQAAIDAGTLTVTDAAAGETIKAWNPADPEATGSAKAMAAATDWTTFLKQHLTRESSGLYVRNPDSSHQDRLTGQSAYFGMIGDTYYYLSWTKPGEATTTPPSSAES
ncbi:MAG: hypothetical protein ACK4N1_14250 [Pseudorhizobium sp.]